MELQAGSFIFEERAVEGNTREAEHNAFFLLGIQAEYLSEPAKLGETVASASSTGSMGTIRGIHLPTMRSSVESSGQHLALLVDQTRTAIRCRRVAFLCALNGEVHGEEACDLAECAHTTDVLQLSVHVTDGVEQFTRHSIGTTDGVQTIR